jgi:hypothetical protein
VDFADKESYKAAQNSHVEVVRGLINLGASMDFACKDVCTPLGLAVQDGHFIVVTELLVHGSSLLLQIL